MKYLIKKGSSSFSAYVSIDDSSSTIGAKLAGLAYNTPGSPTAYYVRQGGAAQPITLATLAAANSAFSSGGFKEVDATNLPGVYRFDIPDAVLATGANTAVIVLKGWTNAVPVHIEIQLIDASLFDVNVTSVDGIATTGGSGAIPVHGVVDMGTAQAAGAGSLTLRAGYTSADSTLIGATVLIVSATAGKSQRRVITGYNDTTKIATVDSWDVTPTGTITYIVFASAAPSLAVPIPADIKKINGVVVNGNGSSTPWGP